MSKTFTVEEIFQAAEKNRFKNTNSTWLAYDDTSWYPRGIPKYKEELPVAACVIGEAFINLGLVPNGYTPYGLSRVLEEIKPDSGTVKVTYTHRGIKRTTEFHNLSEFINELNDVKSYGKKRVVAMARKHFSLSLNKKVMLRKEAV